MKKIKILIVLIQIITVLNFVSAKTATAKGKNSVELSQKNEEKYLTRIKNLLKNNEAKKVKEMLQPKIDKYNNIDNSPKDGKIILDFNDSTEKAIYDLYLNPEKLEVVPLEEKIAIYYYYYSYALYELGEFEAEKEILKNGIRWSPAFPMLYFEYCECLKVLGEMDELFEWTRAVFQVSYYESDVAHCYRNFGYYFVEKGKFDVAAWCYLISLEFEEDSQSAYNELSYIEQVTGKDIVYPTKEEIESVKELIGFDYFCIPPLED